MSGTIPFTVWMAYSCPAFDGESFEAWEKRAREEYRLGNPTPLPECQVFEEQGTGCGLKPKAV